MPSSSELSARVRPFDSMIAFGSPPSATITSSTSLAAEADTACSEMSATRRASASGLTFQASGGTTPTRATSSPVTQFASWRASTSPSPPAAAASK